MPRTAQCSSTGRSFTRSDEHELPSPSGPLLDQDVVELAGAGRGP